MARQLGKGLIDLIGRNPPRGQGTVNQQTNFGKYHLLDQLAADDISEIYKVKTIGIAGFEKVQILKRILPASAQDPRFIRTFIDQAKIAFSLNHRNIVQVFEFGKIDGDLFLAMEYIPGANLMELMREGFKKHKIPPIGLTCYLMGEVAAGLEYAHRKTDHFGQELSIVHCDISPQNIACSFEGSVKILDFGISRAVWDMLSGQHSGRWKPRHLSPEQISGGDLDSRSDLFSFGVILWEMLTGREMFGGSSPDDVVNQVLNKPIPTPQSLNPDIPGHLDDLTMHCLVRDRSQRIESASDLQLELHRIQRMLGAVIGSRALSAFIDEVLPDYLEVRDVRQQGPDHSTARASKTIEPVRTNDLVDAAAELAIPHNPPADPVAESLEVERAIAARPTSTLGPIIDKLDTSGPISHVPSQELAGVLRSGRPMEGEVTSTPDLAFVGSSAAVISTISSEEITAVPHMIDEAFNLGALAEEDLDESTEDLSIEDLLELDQDEVTVGDSPSRTMEDLEIAAESQPDPGQLEDPGVAAAPLQPPPSRADLAQTLGEKKRFFTCMVIIEGHADITEEAKTLIADIAFKQDGILHHQESARLTVLFGLPTTDENDIVSAVRFAHDAQEALTHLGTKLPGADRGASEPGNRAATARIGIRAGTARLGGRPSEEGYHLLGNILAETAILAEHAPAGQVYLAGVAARLSSVHYMLRGVEPLRRHGKSIRCFRVVAPQSRSRQPKPRAAMTPVFGREVELKAIKNIWRETVLQGCQRGILISGEAGIGKSRLIDEFLNRSSADAQVVATSATPHRRGTPYSMFTDLLRSVTGIWSVNSAKARSRMLEALSRLLDDPDDQLLQALGAIMIPGKPRPPDGGGFSSLGVIRAVRKLLNQLSVGRPLILVLEDLHWADSASIKCITTLIENPGDARGPQLFLMSSRPEEDQSPQNIFANQTCSFFILEELDEADRIHMIREVLDNRCTEDLIHEVERRAAGNPFYIHELARAISELKVTGPADVPPTVQGVISGRVDRLSAPVKSLLQHAAVIGPTFREAILSKLIRGNPARPLAILRNRGIIVPGLRVAVPHDGASGQSEQFEREWAFRHVLIQEAVYESISSTARRDLHRRVGKIMSHRVKSGSSDPPAEAARHLELSGTRADAGEFYLRAANEAATAFAAREALALYDKVIALGQAHPDRLYDAHAGRERVYAQLGDHRRQAEDLEALRRLSGDDPARLADLRNREALRLLRLGEFYRALAAAEQAEAAAKEAGDDLVRGEALQHRAEAYERLLDHPRAIDTVTKAIQIFEKQDALPGQIRARIGLGRIYLSQARYDEAYDQYSPALELTRESGDRWLERVLRNNLAVVHYCRGDFKQALDEALYSLKLCEQFGDRAREGDNASVIGIVYLELGLLDLARRYLEGALAIHQQTGSQWSEADTLIYLGILETASRRFHRALRCLNHAKVIAERISAKYITVNARNAIALAFCERGNINDVARAVDEATEATEVARQSRLMVGEILGLSRSARATAALGNLDAAQALSRRAVELLDEQRIIESSEEEIYYTHFRILSILEDPTAGHFLQRAFAGFESKLTRLEAADQRDSFAGGVHLNRAIQRDHERLMD